MQKNDRPRPPRASDAQPLVKVVKAHFLTPLSDWFDSLPPRERALLLGGLIGLMLFFGVLATPSGQTLTGMLVFGLAFAGALISQKGK